MKLNTKDKKKAGIYVIRNLVNQKVYVGKSVNIYTRVKQHITLLNTKSKDENPHLIKAWHKYGKDNFDYYVIEYIDLTKFDTEKDFIDYLGDQETHWIEELHALDREKGYNLRLDSSSGMIASKETKKKLSEANKKRFKDPKERERVSKWAKDFWKDNPDKKEEMRKKLMYKNRKYRYGKYNKETDELIKIYEVVEDILIDHPDFYLQAIKGCCQGQKKSYKGFKWHYLPLDSEDYIVK